MPLQKTLDHILESWLPTKLTILISGSTILLALLAIGLPEYLQKIDTILSPERKLLLRIVSPLSLLFLGTFVKHDLQLLSFVGAYLCQCAEKDNCETMLIRNDYDYRKKCVESRAELQFRS